MKKSPKKTLYAKPKISKRKLRVNAFARNDRYLDSMAGFFEVDNLLASGACGGSGGSSTSDEE